ncbi:hypothetical protein KI659_06940 [Litoribacter alkaliphilus]|uniref:Uncharacterized protein n=1 Tax=Litoribacter ruber TaxID=702568 RepID=A0AAP2CFQ3_9BACT|nr:hypothetical protein [Litoribacter alkaliphilus]MBS9523753.1 hypothetical protein [Litoribacter alkaliphilus]
MIKDDSLRMSIGFNKGMAAICFLLCAVQLVFFGIRFYELKAEPISHIMMTPSIIGSMLSAMGVGLAGFVFLRRKSDSD